MSRAGRHVISSAATAVRIVHNGVCQVPPALEAGGGFWQRLAAAAAAAVAPPQRHMHTQQLPSLQHFGAMNCADSLQPANSDCTWLAAQQRRTFAKRVTRASRSSGGTQPAAAAPDDQPPGQAPTKPSAPAGPTDAEIEAAERHRSEWFADKSTAELEAADVGKFFDLMADRIPEGFQDYYTAAAARGDTFVLKGGCKGLQEELAATKTDLVMYRQIMHDLIQAVASGSKPQLYLEGITGSGKSIALAALADWGRACGRVVVYVPSASLFTDGGLFHKNEEGTWDTPDAAKLLMRTVAAAHGPVLDALPSSSTPGSSLSTVIADGIATTDPHAAVAAAVELLEALRTQTEAPVLFLVDDWNALYWVTGYYEWSGLKRRNILPTELRLANAVKALLMGPPPANGSVVTAVTWGAGISRQLVIPRPRGSLLQILPGRAQLSAVTLQVPRFSVEEMGSYLAHQARTGALPDASAPGLDQVQKMAFHLTGGNAREMRKFGAGLLY